jgi:hypothetical protein
LNIGRKHNQLLITITTTIFAAAAAAANRSLMFPITRSTLSITLPPVRLAVTTLGFQGTNGTSL